MIKLKILIITVTFLLIPFIYPTQSAQYPGEPPPVSPALVRQGDFAISLAEALELGTAFSESEAQEKLSELGVYPENGWIADYPMTPDIIGELQDSVVRASNHGYLAMNPSDAVSIFQSLVADYGLHIIPDGSGTQFSQTPPTYGHYDYTEPAVINNYYYHSGPPIITYYPPPYGYHGLYSWVPYPFWWGGFWFSGYFVLNDFHRSSRVVVLHRYGHKKHFRSPKSVIGVVSNRKKPYHHTRKGFVGRPSQRKQEGYHRPSGGTSSRRWSEPYRSGTKNISPNPRRGIDQRRGPGNHDFIRGNNPSSTRFRDNSNRRLRDNSSSGINPGKTIQRTDRGRGTTRIQTENNPAQMGRSIQRGSPNSPRSPTIRENSSPGVRQNRNSDLRGNRNPSFRGNRESFQRSRSFEGNRSFQRRDNNRSSFQRPERSGNNSSRSWNRGGAGSRELNQSGFSRGSGSGRSGGSCRGRC